MGKRKKERAEFDFYPTPPDCALAICRRLETKIPPPKYIYEPSAGSGSFVAAARQVWPEAFILAIDIRPDAEPYCKNAGANAFICSDWVDFVISDGLPDDTLIVGNPPFTNAQEHVEAGWIQLKKGDTLAFLLRNTFFGANKRSDFWKEFPLRYLAPISPRPSFTGGGTDGAEYSLFTWESGWLGPEGILGEPILWQG